MANDRMYIRCKGCGDLHFLAKCYDDGYFTTHEGEELRQGLDDFFDRHKWCYRDKYYGGFELVYESDDWLENQKEQKPAECERQPEFKEVEYDFRGEKVKVMRPFFRDDKGREFSTTGQDTDLTWSVLREWCEIKGITPYDLYPRAEWSEEDEEMLDIVLTMVDCSTVVPHSGGQLHPSESYKKDISDWLKSFRPQLKQEWSEDDERRRDGIIQWLREYQKEFNPKYDSLSIESIESLIDWLKSLRPSWKPSEEQMKALEAATVRYQSTGLESLYEELKKL